METRWKCGLEEAGRYCVQCGANKEDAGPVGHLVPRMARGGTAVLAPPAKMAGLQGRGGAGTSVETIGGAMQEIGQGQVTPHVNQILVFDCEAMVWEDSPSMALLAGLLIKYGVLLSAVWCAAMVFDGVRYWLLLCVLAAIHVGIRAGQIRCTRYRMTTQRLEVRSGLCNRTSVPYEIHRLSDAVISSSLLLRVFGRENLTILSPAICLTGIRNAEVVRDLLRNAGQIEATRLEKVRWR
jgi:hypothetical protein